ncbi:S1C family serine protease [Lignipirellula cremea]|uniref:S1C family serine protease n=1 Tax=Lignipirellula cremea TaxID=2528010 RepID=UPI0018D247DC|nr:trypsin-like peptidase domain-containing protein [Lignipirellula cremea]
METIFAGSTPASVADLKAMQDRVHEVVKKVNETVVGVRVGSAQGSGVVISEDGFVLTAAHVNGKPGRTVTFIFPDGSTRRGKTLGVNRGVDSGLMKISLKDGEKLQFAEQGDSTKVKIGQWVIAIGHPNGYQEGRQPVVRLGRVLTNRNTVMSTDCTLVGGDSGGPLFNADGEVIAIHSRIGSPLTANMHVPVNSFRDTWDRLAASEEWGSLDDGGPYIGVQGDPNSDKAIIARVYPDAPADKAGIKEGDILTKFDGEKVTDFASLATFVGRKSPGDRVPIEVLRDGETIRLEMTIGVRE